jgi:hypothetical protein
MDISTIWDNMGWVAILERVAKEGSSKGVMME